VLGRFSKDEEPLIAQAVQDAVSAVECMLEENIDIAMNRFNIVGS
jgi:peptidyl-tRNA hydrolase